MGAFGISGAVGSKGQLLKVTHLVNDATASSLGSKAVIHAEGQVCPRTLLSWGFLLCTLCMYNYFIKVIHTYIFAYLYLVILCL